jgi:hypothetical protein
MPSKALEMIEKLKAQLAGQVASWKDKPLAHLPPATVPRRDVGDVLHTLILGEHEEYSIMAVYNRETGGIDLAALYVREDKDPVALIGATFAAFRNDGVTPVAIPEEFAIRAAPDLAAALAESIEPHLGFLAQLRLAELTMPDGWAALLGKNYDFDHVSGMFVLPDLLDGGG